MAKLTSIRERVSQPFFDTLVRPTPKTDLMCLVAVFGPDDGLRLAQLPADSAERQEALAQAALAGEIVGDLATVDPLGAAFTQPLFPTFVQRQK